MTQFSKQEKSWILYDVANSAFTMLVSTTIPIYFRSLAEQSVSEATASGIWDLPLRLRYSFWQYSLRFWERLRTTEE